MAFDFPSGPTNGQTFTPSGGPTYVWNGYAWSLQVGGTSVTISDTPPSSPSPGSLWWESDGGSLWIYYNDGNTSQWVLASGGQVAGSTTTDGAAANTRIDAYDVMYVTKLDTQRVVSGTPKFTFSESNLRVTSVVDATWGTALSYPSTCDWEYLYFEATIVVSTTNVIVGFCNKYHGPSGMYPGSNTYSAGFAPAGTFYYNNTSYAGYPTFTTGDTIAFALRITEGGIWMRNVTTNSYWMNDVNAHPDGSPYTGGTVGYGFMYNLGPLYAAAGLYEINGSVRFNFDGPFLGAVPTNFRRWRGRAAT